MSVAVNYQHVMREAETISNIIDKMSSDYMFLYSLVRSTDVKQTLVASGFKLDGLGLEKFEQTLSNIKKQMNFELEKLANEVMTKALLVESGNGAGGWD